MDVNIDSTCIIKSLKDLNKFMSFGNKSKSSICGSNFSFISPLSAKGSPKMKLSFSESLNNTTLSDSSNNETFLERHRQNIAGLGIAKKIREKDIEIIDGKATISILESRLESLQSSSKKRKLDYESDTDSYKQIKFQNDELISDLQHKIKKLESLEMKRNEEMLKVQKISDDKCNQVENKILQLRSDYLNKENHYYEELSKLKEVSLHQENVIKEKSASLQILETINKELEDRSASLHNKVGKLEKTLLEMEILKTKYFQAQCKIKELEVHITELKTMEDNYEKFDNSMKRLPLLEKEIVKLKDENNTHKLIGLNVGLLEEKLMAAETDINRLELRNRELIAENGTLVMIREMTEKIEAILIKELGLQYMPSDLELVEQLQSLKKRDIESSNTLTELKASLKSHDNSRMNNDELVKTLQMELMEKCSKIVKKDQIIRRLQRKIVLVSKERDILKGIISSYEAETTINPSFVEQERIASLEAILKDYKAEILKLEELLENDGKIIETKNSKTMHCSDHEDELMELKKNINTLSEEKEFLQMKLDHHILKGSYDPTKTKVLHFIENPLEKANQEGIAVIERLQQEIVALKLRVKLLEDGESDDLTQKIGTKVRLDDISSKRLKDLEDEVKTLETRNTRIVEAFKQKSKVMREVVYRLTGYRVDLRGDNMYKLMNAYSDSEDDYLLFEETSDGAMNLLETEFSRTLRTLIEAYLQNDNGYPAFLSAVTLELFSRQTMVQSPHSSNEDDDYEGGDGEHEEGEEEADENDEEYEEEYDENDEMDENEEDDQHHFNVQTKNEDNDDDDLICID